MLFSESLSGSDDRSDRTRESERRVRFSPFPEVHPDIPWRMNSQASKSIERDESVLYPLQSSLKEPVFVLRTEIDPEENISSTGVAILILCMIVLFMLIWFVVHKILLLEIELQIGSKEAASAPLGCLSGLKFL